nr:zinc finger, CCHC-type, retrotransposon Gag domain protein [Tanacetum cinerariifolium]
MHVRKKPHDSMNVRSKSNLNTSLPRTVRCSKHMTGNRALLTNFVEKFLGTVRFGNNDFAVIASYVDVVIRSMMIKKVYYVEGLGHNLFSVRQFCNKGLEVAFRKSTCFVRNEDGVDLLTDDCSSNLYTISLNEVASNSLTCLLAKASSSEDSSETSQVQNGFCFKQASLSFHMDLCGPMRVRSINGKRYVLVVVDDYSWYTWRVRTDNGTEFKNKTLAKFFDEFGITQQISATRTPQQNGVMERRNRTLVEAARTMLTFANLPSFLWAEAIATACFTQNCSIIHKRFDKTPYELINKRKPNIRTVHKWLPKLQPLAEPVAKWFPRIVQICLWIIDSGCSKHMMGNHDLLTNFVEMFLGTVRFRNNDFAVIVGYGDVVIGSMTINKVNYVEGLGHNLFSVGQFCDNSLEDAFRNKGFSSQSCLWHQRLSHLNFATINNLVKNNLVQGLPKRKFEKDHLCSVCEQGKTHWKHHKSKTAFASNKPLYLLHMDLCGPMCVQSINGKRYVLVVVDDYSRYTWVFFLHSKDEASEVIISFIKKTKVNLQLQVQRDRTDNGTEFKNKTLDKFFDEVGITQQFSAARTPQQNGVVERRNRTLVEAARTMLTFAILPSFLWAKAIATACFTQNSLIIHKHYDVTSSLRRGALQFWYQSQMVNTRTDTDLTTAVQNALQAMLPRIREEIREEFRTGSGPSNAGGNPTPVTIHTWLERFNKQKPNSFEKATVPVDAENWISHIEKIFDVMGCEDDFKTRLAVYKFEGNALAWWKAYKQAKGGDTWLVTVTWADFKKLFFLQFFPRAEQERLKREYHSIRPSNAGGNPTPVTIHTWLERFNKQKPNSFEKATVPVDTENWISLMEKIFDVMGCEDAFKTRLAVYKFEGNALAWWKAYKQAKGGDTWLVTVTWADFKKLFYLQFFPRAEQERLKREYHSIRQTSSESSTEFMQRFLRLAGFIGAAAGTEEEQAKNFQWGLRRSTLNHLMCMSYTDVAQVANAARNYEILHERDDQDSERPDKRQRSGDRHQQNSQQSSHRSHGQNNDRHGSDRRGGNDNHRGNNNSNNYSGSNNRNSGNGRDQRNRGHQSNRSTNSVISATFASRITTTPTLLDHVLCISTPMQDSVRITHVYRNLPLQFDDKIRAINAYPLDMCEFDLILGMDWLTEHHATIDCHSYRVIFGDIHAPESTYHGSLPRKPMQIISAL